MTDEKGTTHTREILSRARLGVALLAVRMVVMQLVVLGGNVYLTRALSPGDFGIFAIVQFVMLFFDLLGDAGLAAALIKEKELPDRRTMSTVFWFQVLLSLGIIALVWATSALVPAGGLIVRGQMVLPADAVGLLRALSVVLLLTVLRVPCGIQMERGLQFGRQSSIDVINKVVYFSVAVPMASAGYGPKALLTAVVAQSATSMVVAHILSPFRPLFVLDWSILRPILKYGATVQLRSLVGYTNGSITPLFAGARLGRTDLGLNNWAQGFAYFPLEFVQIISRVSFPVFSQIRDDKVAFERAFEKSIQRVALISFFFTSLVLGMGPSLVSVVYTDKWLPAMPSLYIYSAAMTVGCLSPLVASALDAIGKPGIIARLSIGWMLLNWLVVGIVLTVAPGRTNFAAAYCVHVVVGNLAIVAVLKHEFPGVGATRALMAPAVGLGAAAAVGRWGLRPLIHGPVSLVVAILAAAAVFVSVAAAVDRPVRDEMKEGMVWAEGRLKRPLPWTGALIAFVLIECLLLVASWQGWGIR
jgi:PST family polysaccharide transporter